MYKFKHYTDDFVKLPTSIGDHTIIKKFDGIEDFVDQLFPTLGASDEIPETIILTPKNKNMFEINDMCLEKYRPQEEIIEAKSKDVPYIPEQEGMFPEELMNNYDPGSLPRHNLRLKPGCSLMLLRNVNLYEGLANGTRLRLLSISESRKVMKVEIMTGPKAKKNVETGQPIFTLPERTFPLFQIPCTNEDDPVIRMVRKQFPVRLTYCMSINKAQGQTLKKVGLYLPNPVFSHGQLYVAMSRVSRPEDILIYIQTDNETHGDYRGKWYTKNVVYDQLLKDEIEKFKSSEKFVDPNPYEDTESDDDYGAIYNHGDSVESDLYPETFDEEDEYPDDLYPEVYSEEDEYQEEDEHMDDYHEEADPQEYDHQVTKKLNKKNVILRKDMNTWKMHTQKKYILKKMSIQMEMHTQKKHIRKKHF
jgi:hypothetical protein